MARRSQDQPTSDMKRDETLMVAILAVAENATASTNMGDLAHLSSDERALAYQVQLMEEQGMVRAVVSRDGTGLPDSAVILDITALGHEFLGDHAGCTSLITSTTLRNDLLSLAASQSLPALAEQAARLLDVARNDPGLAVGTSKEILETVCKSILTDRGIDLPDKFPALVKRTRGALSLFPTSGSDDDGPEDSLRQAAAGVSQIANAVNQLRNSHGTGHGRSAATGLTVSHARFVVGTTVALACFLLESHASSP